MVHHKRPEKIDDPGPILGEMRKFRQVMVEASTRVKPMGPVYQGFSMVMAAIDALATLLIGRNDYFWAHGGGVTEDQRKQIAADAADEAGAKRTER